MPRTSPAFPPGMLACCPKRRCNKVYQRHRQSIDPAKHVCSRCKGRLTFLGKFSKANKLLGTPVRCRMTRGEHVRRPSRGPFATHVCVACVRCRRPRRASTRGPRARRLQRRRREVGTRTASLCASGSAPSRRRTRQVRAVDVAPGGKHCGGPAELVPHGTGCHGMMAACRHTGLDDHEGHRRSLDGAQAGARAAAAAGGGGGESGPRQGRRMIIRAFVPHLPRALPLS